MFGKHVSGGKNVSANKMKMNRHHWQSQQINNKKKAAGIEGSENFCSPLVKHYICDKSFLFRQPVEKFKRGISGLQATQQLLPWWGEFALSSSVWTVISWVSSPWLVQHRFFSLHKDQAPFPLLVYSPSPQKSIKCSYLWLTSNACLLQTHQFKELWFICWFCSNYSLNN